MDKNDAENNDNAVLCISMRKDFKKAIELEAFRRNISVSAFVKNELSFCLEGLPHKRNSDAK